jgi:hypothetical protein
MWGYEMTSEKKIGRNSEDVWTVSVSIANAPSQLRLIRCPLAQFFLPLRFSHKG